MSIVGPLRYRASPCLRCGEVPHIWRRTSAETQKQVWAFACGCGYTIFNGWLSKGTAVEFWNNRNEAIGGDLVL